MTGPSHRNDACTPASIALKHDPRACFLLWDALVQPSRFDPQNAPPAPPRPRWWVPVLAIALAWGAALVAPRCAPQDTDIDTEVTEPSPPPPHHMQQAAPAQARSAAPQEILQRS